MKRLFVFVSALLLLMTFATASFADLDDFTWPKKIKRGAANVLTAPVEIPKQIIAGAYERPALIMMFSGLLKGVAYTMGRMGSGMWDIFTCNLDVSDAPLMKPPCVFEDWPGASPKK